MKVFKGNLLFLLLFWSMPSMGQGSRFCTNNELRSWWDVTQYDLSVDFSRSPSRIYGVCRVKAKVLSPYHLLQLDLKEPLTIDSILMHGHPLPYQKKEDYYVVTLPKETLAAGATFEMTVFYSGVPVVAMAAPWQSGVVRETDAQGKPWMGVVSQGEGGSVWFPCKNFQGDEPASVVTHFTVPYNLVAIGNGKLTSLVASPDLLTRTWTWTTTNPINHYNITFYIGDYVHYSSNMNGKSGLLSLDYYVLREDATKAWRHFSTVPPVLACFEEKMGPYPFYKDGYKLVQAPYLGMEHQSAVAYGNGFQMGYKGKDRSQTGIGMLFDFIIVHETGHEWFGNSITAYDKADTWIHEGFTSYSETIYVECLADKESAFQYQRGKKHLILNDKPVQGRAGACDEGSGDHYDKAAFMIHMIRLIMEDDTRFYALLRDMNRRYYHRLVRSRELEQWINRYTGRNFNPVFNQYLRTATLPVLELKPDGQGGTTYRWARCVPGFNMPVRVTIGNKEQWIRPTTTWKVLPVAPDTMVLSEDFLIEQKRY